MTTMHQTAIVAAARTLAKRFADSCNVNAEDVWNLHAGEFTDDASAALEAAGVTQLLDALRAVVKEADGPGKPYDGDSYLPPHLIFQARDAISRMTGGAS